MINPYSENIEVTVTQIAGRYYARLYKARGKFPIDEMACRRKSDVGWICREMLRQYSKLGGISRHAESARRRQRGKPAGRVWRKEDIDAEREALSRQ